MQNVEEEERIEKYAFILEFNEYTNKELNFKHKI